MSLVSSRRSACCFCPRTARGRGEQLCDALAFGTPGICGGEPSEAQIEREIRFIRACANQEGSRPLDDSWVFARYNDRSWPKGPFRRNDFLIPLDEATIDLWRGVDWDFVKRVAAQRI